ncbi:hypothetical protein ILUMI_10683 [Ignelater luminosus]|uniref:Uncharacterized protein n=1 Tax=Ignelater luminosus TaxID=2038154 RepID=A0A8K0D1P8_IGNLU|nr:hypothetical protein ILUMI_10683 [Ignelater luminosus]
MIATALPQSGQYRKHRAKEKKLYSNMDPNLDNYDFNAKGNVPNLVLVQTESLYRTNDSTKRFETLLKPRKRLEQVTLRELPLGWRIKKKKLLISFSGENWNTDPELGWIVPISTEDQEDELRKVLPMKNVKVVKQIM